MSGKSNRRSSVRGLVRVGAVSATIIAATGFTAGLAGVASAQAVGDADAISARVEAYRGAWNTHDPSALAAFFTEDADVVMGNLPGVRGRREIRDWWRDYFERQEPERRLTLDVSPTRFVASDVAVLNVVTATGGRDRQGEELPVRKFRGTWLWRRQSDNWLISAMRGLPYEEDRVVLNSSVEAAKSLRPQIRSFVDTYEEAFNSHDPSAVSGFYNEDAEIIVRNLPATHGRQAIEEWWRTYFSQPRPYRAIFIIDDIRMITPDVALINLTTTGATSQTLGESSAVRYTRATWVTVREARDWRIAALWVLPSRDDRIIRNAGRPN